MKALAGGLEICTGCSEVHLYHPFPWLVLTLPSVTGSQGSEMDPWAEPLPWRSGREALGCVC